MFPVSETRVMMSIVLLSTAVMGCTAHPGQGPAWKPDTRHEDIHKAQVQQFLNVIKNGLDSDVLGDPKRWQALGGVKVQAWNEYDPGQSQSARSVTFKIPLLDARKNSREDGRTFGFSYAIRTTRPDGGMGYRIDFWNIANLSCVTPGETASIFGAARIRMEPRPAPLHGQPQSGPAWMAGAYHYDAARRRLVTLGYQVAAGGTPVATCLNALTITLDALPPSGYFER